MEEKTNLIIENASASGAPKGFPSSLLIEANTKEAN